MSLDGSGNSILAYWNNAVNIPETGKPLITYDWYLGLDRSLLPALGTPWPQPKSETDATRAPRPAGAPIR